MIKHFCDICKNEMTQRIRVNITAKEVYGEGYLKTVGENLMDTDFECCCECYSKLVDLEFIQKLGGNIEPCAETNIDIVDTVGQEKSFSIFDKLGKLIKNGKKGR